MTTTSQFTRITTAAIGALVISTAFIAAAVGPATSAGQSQAVAASQVQSSVQARA